MEMDDFIDTTADGRPLRAVNQKRSSASGGVAIICQGGYCVDTTVYDNDGNVIREWPRPPVRLVRPQEAFIAAIRSRKIADLRPDILDGHLSTAVCHMGNISLECGESMPLAKAAAAQVMRDDSHASAAMERMMRHLEANAIDPNAVNVTMGAKLTMDSRTERFVGEASERGNWFVKDSYREGFVIPEGV
jgi:hypothetical protein